MRRLKRPAALLLLSMTSACSSITATEPPQITGTAEQICRTWETIRPSRKDVLTDETAKMIVGNNVAREQWCPPPKFASVTART